MAESTCAYEIRSPTFDFSCPACGHSSYAHYDCISRKFIFGCGHEFTDVSITLYKNGSGSMTGTLLAESADFSDIDSLFTEV